ncbi:MAG: SurA N-terminal domain-containing protein, partial [Planctomycetota bacterium]
MLALAVATIAGLLLAAGVSASDAHTTEDISPAVQASSPTSDNTAAADAVLPAIHLLDEPATDSATIRPAKVQPATVRQAAGRPAGVQPATAILPIQPANATTKKSANKIVAVVNAEPITRKALRQQALRRYGTRMTEKLVNKMLVLQECEKRGISVSQNEVRDEIISMAKGLKLDPGAFLQFLSEQSGMSYDEYARQVIWPKVALKKLVEPSVVVDEASFERAFAAQYGESIKCLKIVAKDAESAQRYYSMAVSDPDQFGDIAKKHSIDRASASLRGLVEAP